MTAVQMVVMGRILKDLAALINTASSENEKKYLICGFDEQTKKCQNYDTDTDGNKIKFFNQDLMLNQK